MERFRNENLSHDPVHGYIPFTSNDGLSESEASERDLIDSVWVQRLRQIHQLQTAWWVFPSAEHTRFQHVLGAMYLASRTARELYASLAEVCPDVPSRGYVESLLRLAALLHDVGHGPFGHFLDTHLLKQYDLTHETLGAEIIRRELADTIRAVRRNPYSQLEPGETLDPEQLTFLITRPREVAPDDQPRWLIMLRSLFCGLYTVDNMDFVLRDAYMSGFSSRSFDLERLLHYSVFTEKGFTIHERGLSALLRFLSVRSDLFRSIYFHRTVRAIDLTLEDLFVESRDLLFPGNPVEHLDEYLRFTEWSLLVNTANWGRSDNPQKRELADGWRRFMQREIPWTMACERTVVFQPGESETSSVFSSRAVFEAALRDNLPPHLKDLPIRADSARLVHRPGAHAPAAGQNFIYDPSTKQIDSLEMRQLYRELPLCYRICRIYAHGHEHREALAAALDRLTSSVGLDDATNM